MPGEGNPRESSDRLGWAAGVVGALVAWGVMFLLVFGVPNVAEAIVGGGVGLAVGVLARAVVSGRR